MVHPDHQYDPAYIPELARPLLDGECEAVFGSRCWAASGRSKAACRSGYLANLFLTVVANATFYVFSEYHSGLRAYSRRYLETVDLEGNSTTSFDTEIIAQGVFHGLRIREIPSAPVTSPKRRRSASGGAYMASPSSAFSCAINFT